MKLSRTAALMDDLISAHYIEIGHAGVTKTHRSLHRALKGIPSLPNGPTHGAVQWALHDCIYGGTYAHVKPRNVSDGKTSRKEVTGPRQQMQADLVHSRQDRPGERYYLTLKDMWEDDLHYILLGDKKASTIRSAFQRWIESSPDFLPTEILMDLGIEFQADWAAFLE
uniref:Integrase catalytic domain-containing protein n=1 Tax=Chromera velia CCMP2878 TaxID=1169474 RepID=A0A0G4ID02_9ALVE|eukprot:Cvel_2308.t1-p1 / transcript=Cvel_2308.t1 / gene=Cvel_2308 / organism=Chromera_velia_CCMP2878 / gene_product=hypothetical protein / transcript_product=hypothetical protein / location=Cvel_scaffold89:76136-76636(+) / protein_length=167 / sequence_SO=supercontig / SO=protein_coding / is_pseudo=false